MSNPREPMPAKLVIGLFMKDRALFAPLADDLAAGFGSVDIVSSWMAFDYTTYYEPEMGTPLFRRMLTFKNLIRQDQLPEIKLTTNRLEQSLAQNGLRRVNIDPGYLLFERFVLATGKNFSHRIYIGSRIYADLTLIYQRGRFQKLDWTFPDYADEPMLQFLTRVRRKYAVDVKTN
ncbi:FIG00602555: hypothetical protein [Olavius algarvensis Delta 1 endosymbiont]|nr:FIG00602555: hypothetical protein [Olavius algarvensis Delta 1 endosymbiont]